MKLKLNLKTLPCTRGYCCVCCQLPDRCRPFDAPAVTGTGSDITDVYALEPSQRKQCGACRQCAGKL